jgi:hypothetical protein
MTGKEVMDGALLAVFPGRLLQISMRKVFPIADRFRAHDEGTVANRVGAHKGRIEMRPMASTFGPIGCYNKII